jgi:hypothetical protein
VMVCYFWASTGGFYRHGRARESGFQILAEAGKIPGTAAPSLTFGRGDGSVVSRFLRSRSGRLGDIGNGQLACISVG